MSIFEIWQNAQGEYYWTLTDDAGVRVARSENYLEREEARQSAEKVKEWSGIPAEVKDV